MNDMRRLKGNFILNSKTTRPLASGFVTKNFQRNSCLVFKELPNVLQNGEISSSLSITLFMDYNYSKKTFIAFGKYQ